MVIDASDSGFGLTTWAQIAHNRLESILICLIQQDELVWDHTHLLQSDCLGFSPGEALNDPTFLPLFHLLDLLLDQFYYNFISHVTVSLQRLLDIFTVLLVLLDFLPSDEITH